MPEAGTKSNPGLYIVGGDISSSAIKNNDKMFTSPHININNGESVEDIGKSRLRKRLKEIARERGLPHEYTEKFADIISAEIDKVEKSLISASLPKSPIRDYRNGEDVIEYIRSSDGFAPWIAAGALNRPLIRDLAPKAYMALGNYLRRNELPNDLKIPTKSELLDNEEISEESLRAARRLLRRAERKGTARD